MRRRWRAPGAVLAAALALVLATALSIVLFGGGSPTPALSGDPPEAFRGATGLGRAVDLSRCAAAFDPRIGGACDLRYAPLPGAAALCPDHALPPWPERR